MNFPLFPAWVAPFTPPQAESRCPSIGAMGLAVHGKILLCRVVACLLHLRSGPLAAEMDFAPAAGRSPVGFGCLSPFRGGTSRRKS